jgi:hypothetical protein
MAIVSERGRFSIVYKYKGEKGRSRFSTVKSAINTIKGDSDVKNGKVKIVEIDQLRHKNKRPYWDKILDIKQINKLINDLN